MSQLKITQVRSTIGARWKQRESLRTLVCGDSPFGGP